MGILRDTQLNSAKKAMNVYSLQKIWGVSLNKCFLATPRKSVADVLKITSNKWSKKQLKQQVNGWKQDCGEDLKILLKKSACKDPKDVGHKNRWNISTNNMDT